MVALADVVKASDEDLAWLHPHEPYEAVAERRLSSGAVVLITLCAAPPVSRAAAPVIGSFSRARRHASGG